MRTWLAICILAVSAVAGAIARADAAGSVTFKWSATPIVTMALTPNYALGFGTVPAVFGAQPSPVPGPGSCFQGCAVDFGPVLAGDDYLYKYATHLNVTTNDAAGFDVYGEGAADFTNQADGSTYTLSQTLYYLPSTSGSTSDLNTGYSPSLPFYKTAGAVSGGGPGTPPTITYTTYPLPTYSSSAASADYYIDYQLKVPSAATNGPYYVWIVYTVVAK